MNTCVRPAIILLATCLTVPSGDSHGEDLRGIRQKGRAPEEAAVRGPHIKALRRDREGTDAPFHSSPPLDKSVNSTVKVGIVPAHGNRITDGQSSGKTDRNRWKHSEKHRHDLNLRGASLEFTGNKSNGKGRSGHDKSITDGPRHTAPPAGSFAEKHKHADKHRQEGIKQFVNSRFGKQVELRRQWELHREGDLSRRMNLGQQLALQGGWQKRLCGPVDPHYSKQCFSSWYSGPGYFPAACWFPQWSPWVDWCWSRNCLPAGDPRPVCCRPATCTPCGPWGGWLYPEWTSLPVVACGTWVEVPVAVVDAGYDVQLLAVRFVDPGHPQQQIGPRYRVWLRNNSLTAIAQAFNVLVYASNSREPGMGMPQTGLRVPEMAAGQIQSVDLRLPVEANSLDRDAQGRKVPYHFLHVIVDSHRELAETCEANNGAVLDRHEILPVDPALFAAERTADASEMLIQLAGEGFGPEPGQVVVHWSGMERQAEIVGWYDLGVLVRLPKDAQQQQGSVELVVVRGDRAVSNPLTVAVSGVGGIAQENGSPLP